MWSVTASCVVVGSSFKTNNGWAADVEMSLGDCILVGSQPLELVELTSESLYVVAYTILQGPTFKLDLATGCPGGVGESICYSFKHGTIETTNLPSVKRECYEESLTSLDLTCAASSIWVQSNLTTLFEPQSTVSVYKKSTIKPQTRAVFKNKLNNETLSFLDGVTKEGLVLEVGSTFSQPQYENVVVFSGEVFGATDDVQREKYCHIEVRASTISNPDCDRTHMIWDQKSILTL